LGAALPSTRSPPKRPHVPESPERVGMDELKGRRLIGLRRSRYGGVASSSRQDLPRPWVPYGVSARSDRSTVVTYSASSLDGPRSFLMTDSRPEGIDVSAGSLEQDGVASSPSVALVSSGWFIGAGGALNRTAPGRPWLSRDRLRAQTGRLSGGRPSPAAGWLTSWHPSTRAAGFRGGSRLRFVTVGTARGQSPAGADLFESDIVWSALIGGVGLGYARERKPRSRAPASGGRRDRIVRRRSGREERRA
jgi:hypothetical protein